MLHISMLRILKSVLPHMASSFPLVEGSSFEGAAGPPSGKCVAWKDVLGREGPGLDSCTLGQAS